MFSECWTSPVTHSICLHVSARSADFTVQSGIFNPPGQQHLNPMCQTHTQTLLQKSGDDYFKQTKFLLSWKWKSQIPKSITHKNPPALPFLPIRTACDFSWFQDFNTTFFFFPQYSLPWLLVMVTRYVFWVMRRSLHEHVLPEKKWLSFFGKHFPRIYRSAGNLGNGSGGPRCPRIVSSGFLPHTCGRDFLSLCFPPSRLRWRHRGFNKESDVTIGLWSQVNTPLDLTSFLFFNAEKALEEICRLCRMKKDCWKFYL